jgi:hypothetical protein
MWLKPNYINMKTFFNHKHIFLVIIFSIIFSSCLYAQKEEKISCKQKKEIFTFGPRVSLNFSNDCDGYNTKQFRAGADFGLFFRIAPTRCYLQPEINYQIRSAYMYEYIGQGGLSLENYKSHHIDVPLLLGIKAIDFKLFKFRIYFGPDFSFRIYDNSKWYSILHYNNPNFQLGFQTGIGFDFWRITIDASYSNLNSLNYKFWVRGNQIFKASVGFKCF